MDLDKVRVLFATEGKGGDTIGRFAEDLLEHGASPDDVKEVSMDMFSSTHTYRIGPSRSYSLSVFPPVVPQFLPVSKEPHPKEISR